MEAVGEATQGIAGETNQPGQEWEETKPGTFGSEPIEATGEATQETPGKATEPGTTPAEETDVTEQSSAQAAMWNSRVTSQIEAAQQTVAVEPANWEGARKNLLNAFDNSLALYNAFGVNEGSFIEDQIRETRLLLTQAYAGAKAIVANGNYIGLLLQDSIEGSVKVQGNIEIEGLEGDKISDKAKSQSKEWGNQVTNLLYNASQMVKGSSPNWEKARTESYKAKTNSNMLTIAFGFQDRQVSLGIWNLSIDLDQGLAGLDSILSDGNTAKDQIEWAKERSAMVEGLIKHNSSG